MKRFFQIYRKELAMASHSFMAYLVIAVFIAVSSYFFISLLASFSYASREWKASAAGAQMSFNVTEMVLSALLVNMAALALFFTPFLSMRSFSEEKRQGTLELLLTLPVKDHEVLAGKYLAMLSLYSLMIVPVLVYPLLVQIAGSYFEWETVITGFVGLALLGSAFLALGIFVSSLTENQVISSLASLGLLLAFWMMGWIDVASESSGISWVGHLSIFEHFKSFAQGILNLKDIIFFVFFTAFFLASALFSLEARNLRR